MKLLLAGTILALALPTIFFTQPANSDTMGSVETITTRAPNGELASVERITTRSSSEVALATLADTPSEGCRLTHDLTLLVADPFYTRASDAESPSRWRVTLDHLSDAGWEGRIVGVGSPGASELARMTQDAIREDHPDLVVVAPPDVTMEWARSVVGPCG